MPRHNLARTLVAVLAVSALAAPAAVARPADPVSPQARNAAATAKAHHAQDLRRLDAGNDIRTSPYPSGNRTPARPTTRPTVRLRSRTSPPRPSAATTARRGRRSRSASPAPCC